MARMVPSLESKTCASLDQFVPENLGKQKSRMWCLAMEIVENPLGAVTLWPLPSIEPQQLSCSKNKKIVDSQNCRKFDKLYMSYYIKNAKLAENSLRMWILQQQHNS
jgi:hypothetical protein